MKHQTTGGTEMTKRQQMMNTVVGRLNNGMERYLTVGTRDSFFGAEITIEQCDEWIKRCANELVVLASTSDADYDSAIAAIHCED